MKFSLRHQSSGVLYTYISQTLFWMFANHFRRIHVHNRQRLPTDQPVLLAGNHPTAFVDPVLMGYLMHPPVYNMTRGDLFMKPTARKALEQFNMFPVFRAKDGFTEQDRNDPVMEYCRQKMLDRRIVCVYVEGQHHIDKRILPPQKGLARIAFDTYEKYQMQDLQIIPIGFNYFYPERSRNTAMINLGEPMYIRDYWADYQLKPAAAVLRLCRDIEANLRTLCYHIVDPKDDELAEMLLTIHRSEHPDTLLPVRTFDHHFFLAEKAVLDRMNAMETAAKQDLQPVAEQYFSNLDQAGLSDTALMNPQWSALKWWVFVVLGSPLFLIGSITQWPVNQLAAWAASKVKKFEFKSSIYMGVAHFSGMLLYLTLFLIALCTFRPIWISMAIAMPFLGWFSMFYTEVASRTFAALKAKKSKKRTQLLDERAELRKLF